MTIPYLPSVDWYAAYIAANGSLPPTLTAYSPHMHINRCCILMPTGPQTLTIPLVAHSAHTSSDDLIISNHGRWRSHHWNALQTAYGKSPFFEYYADDFRPFYTQPYERFAHYTAALHHLVCQLIDIQQIAHLKCATSDDRCATSDVTYYQVFANRLGFQPHMSIVDLLFNMGPESILILLRQAGFHKET